MNFTFPTSPGFLVPQNPVSGGTLKICPLSPRLWFINDYKMLNGYLSRKKSLLPKGKRKLGTDPEEQYVSDHVSKALKSARSKA